MLAILERQAPGQLNLARSGAVGIVASAALQSCELAESGDAHDQGARRSVVGMVEGIGYLHSNFKTQPLFHRKALDERQRYRLRAGADNGARSLVTEAADGRRKPAPAIRAGIDERVGIDLLPETIVPHRDLLPGTVSARPPLRIDCSRCCSPCRKDRSSRDGHERPALEEHQPLRSAPNRQQSFRARVAIQQALALSYRQARTGISPRTRLRRA